jgi:hypothetical protein
MSARGWSSSDFLERFQAKLALGLDPEWKPVRVKNQNGRSIRAAVFLFVSFCVSETHHA